MNWKRSDLFGDSFLAVLQDNIIKHKMSSSIRICKEYDMQLHGELSLGFGGKRWVAISRSTFNLVDTRKACKAMILPEFVYNCTVHLRKPERALCRIGSFTLQAESPFSSIL
jgi:hypothetical protein